MQEKSTQTMPTNPLSQTPSVAILLCTYNGEPFLAEQLASYEAQTYHNWQLWVSDDGSSDQTKARIQKYKDNHPDRSVHMLDGPRKGFVKNFLSLTANPNLSADFYAWSDQDDIWLDDKLERGLAWLQQQPSDIPSIYCGRTTLINEKNQTIGASSLFSKTPSFKNALVQSIAGSNTMVFNHAAKCLLEKTPSDINLVSHDWWAYLLISACGGRLYYDQYPSIKYRQHKGNLVGENLSLAAKIKRIKQLFKGDFNVWNEWNIAALGAMSQYITPENAAILSDFILARQKNILSRLLILKKTGIYRQTISGNIGLTTAIIFNKL